eukprot:CAMPEP_0183347140 /NCGR_PEP_ID=MMETSP0164_2-20130417/12055_1 /TAXON_ID=221442 /ORGANISM="Coccolithus pelagicus ssp braarudi, Strain PLY182g" /LENGTH=39 /DNA_ID= /DNA_START= /DNA_END= /DNA_ORIENTATION=
MELGHNSSRDTLKPSIGPGCTQDANMRLARKGADAARGP